MFSRFFSWINSFFKKKPTPRPPRPTEPSEPLPPVEPDSDRKLVGIDIYWRDVIEDWAKLAKHIDFMFIKASEGDWRDDPDFKEHRAKAKKHGIPCGFYHFYRSNKDPREQAERLIKMVGKIEVGEMPVVIDWETEDDRRDGNDADEVKVFLDIVEAHFGMVPIIYGGASFIKGKRLDQSWVRYPLWVAHYTTAAGPRMPAPWPRYTFWQNTSSAMVPGMGKKCDHNFFNGSIRDLQKYIK